MNAGITCVHSLTHVLSSCPFMFFMVRGITSRLRVFALNIPGFPSAPPRLCVKLFPVFHFYLFTFVFYLVAFVFLLLVILSTEIVK